MRDPKRLDILYDKLSILHKRVPDLRFGQLMSNFFSWCQSTGRCSDIFFVEDDKWIRWLDEYMGDK